jgi:hypothetical protein
MSFFNDLGGGRLRRARALEASGDYRGAASVYAELSMFVEASKCLVHEGEKAPTLEARLGAWLDAARVLPEKEVDALREVDTRIGRAVVEHLRPTGVAGNAEKRQLTDAAERLERAEQWRDAADAWELLGRADDLARCLELGGEVERLERVLTEQNESDAKGDRIRRLLSEHDLALSLGQRAAARQALLEASRLAPSDAGIATTLRRLEERAVRGGVLRLSLGARTLRVVGKLPVVLGRAEADVALRGGSVSRRHAEVAREGEEFVLRDLGSRNGTLVAGVLLSRAMPIAGPLEVGLGDDVAVRLTPSGTTLEIEVVRGLDRGEVVLVGQGSVELHELGVGVRFEPDRTVIEARLERPMFGERALSEVELLRGDVLTIGGQRVEVIA